MNRLPVELIIDNELIIIVDFHHFGINGTQSPGQVLFVGPAEKRGAGQVLEDSEQKAVVVSSFKCNMFIV